MEDEVEDDAVVEENEIECFNGITEYIKLFDQKFYNFENESSYFFGRVDINVYVKVALSKMKIFSRVLLVEHRLPTKK